MQTTRAGNKVSIKGTRQTKPEKRGGNYAISRGETPLTIEVGKHIVLKALIKDNPREVEI